MNHFFIRFGFGLLLCYVVILPIALAQNYPIRPVKIIVASAPGSTPDIVARLLGQELAKEWGQGVVIENKASAGGVLAIQQILQSPADGYTLLLSPSSATSLAPAMFKLPYDVREDLSGITRIANVPNVLIIHPSVPARNLKEFIDYVRSRPGKLNYASTATGTPSHLDGELFKALTGIDMLHVPYKGSPAALMAVLSGEVQAMFCPVAIALPYLKQGKVKALGVTTTQRSEILPDVPPIGEAEVLSYSTAQWYGFFARAGTPAAIIKKLNSDAVRIMRTPAVDAVLKPMGVNSFTSTPAELDDFLDKEINKWKRLVTEAKIVAD